MTEDKEESDDVLSYLKEIGLARERGGAFYEKSQRVPGTVKGISIMMANMINKAMKHKDTEVITVRRKDLPVLIGTTALTPPELGKPPIIKGSVREFLRARGIKIAYGKGYVDFIKIKPKKY